MQGHTHRIPGRTHRHRLTGAVLHVNIETHTLMHGHVHAQIHMLTKAHAQGHTHGCIQGHTLTHRCMYSRGTLSTHDACPDMQTDVPTHNKRTGGQRCIHARSTHKCAQFCACEVPVCPQESLPWATWGLLEDSLGGHVCGRPNPAPPPW